MGNLYFPLPPEGEGWGEGEKLKEEYHYKIKFLDYGFCF